MASPAVTCSSSRRATWAWNQEVEGFGQSGAVLVTQAYGDGQWTLAYPGAEAGGCTISIDGDTVAILDDPVKSSGACVLDTAWLDQVNP